MLRLFPNSLFIWRILQISLDLLKNILQTMKTQTLKFLFATSIVFALTSCNNKTNQEPLVIDEVPQEVESVNYAVVTDDSIINWEGYKPGTTHTGLISIQEGQFSLKDGKIAGGSFVIDMTSIVVTDLEGDYKAGLEAHLMGTAEGKEDDFFNINNFPTANFKATGTSSRDGKIYLIGDLTLKGETQEVGFPFKMNQLENGIVEITSEPFTIDRSRWGIKFGSKSFFDNLGDKFVSDDMQLEIKLLAKEI